MFYNLRKKCFNCALDSDTDITEEKEGHILKIEDEVNALNF